MRGEQWRTLTRWAYLQDTVAQTPIHAAPVFHKLDIARLNFLAAAVDRDLVAAPRQPLVRTPAQSNHPATPTGAN
jgi:hypothetical protein